MLKIFVDNGEEIKWKGLKPKCSAIPKYEIRTPNKDAVTIIRTRLKKMPGFRYQSAMIINNQEKNWLT
jgi:hypothetical protein